MKVWKIVTRVTNTSNSYSQWSAGKEASWILTTRSEQKNQKTDKIGKKPNREKNRLEFWKNRPVWFQFYKSETEKTKPKKSSQNRAKPEKTEPKPKKRAKPKKPSQTGKNLAKPVWTDFCSKKSNRTEPKPVGLNRFRFFFF